MEELESQDDDRESGIQFDCDPFSCYHYLFIIKLVDFLTMLKQGNQREFIKQRFLYDVGNGSRFNVIKLHVRKKKKCFFRSVQQAFVAQP